MIIIQGNIGNILWRVYTTLKIIFNSVVNFLLNKYIYYE